MYIIDIVYTFWLIRVSIMIKCLCSELVLGREIAKNSRFRVIVPFYLFYSFGFL